MFRPCVQPHRNQGGSPGRSQWIRPGTDKVYHFGGLIKPYVPEMCLAAIPGIVRQLHGSRRLLQIEELRDARLG